MSVTAALAASLILSMLPPVTARVGAAPPEPVREAMAASSEGVTADSEVVADSNAEPGSLPPVPRNMLAPLPGTEAPLGEESAPGVRTSADFGSVRPRGLEAPVELEQQEPQVAAHQQEKQHKNTNADSSRDEKRDPGDGPVKKRAKAAQERERAPQGIRVWPMPADSYAFTQQFGCVPQLGNLYFPGEGCPAETPVIHTGIDLAAPEGTLFYAAASGWVTLADYDRPTADANTRIIIQHDGRNEHYATDYLHWIASYVKEGDYVQAGDPIGEVGSVGFSTGPHLHFSVTDLETGEHIDPLRWLPEEPGLEGYISRKPNAQLRLPAGTTAGQPESADPAPPPPPVREDVPKSPPADSGGDRSGRDKRKGEQRRAEKGDKSATDKSDRSGNKRSRDDAASPDDSDESAEAETTKRDRSRKRERTRENGSTAEANDTGDVGRDRDNPDDPKGGNHRRDRNGSDDPGSGDKQERNNTSDHRNRSNDGGQRDAGGRDQGNGERRDQDQDRDSPGRDKRASEGSRDHDESSDRDGEATGGDTTPKDAGGNGGAGEGGGDGKKRDRSDEGHAVVTPPPANDRPERGNRDRREKT